MTPRKGKLKKLPETRAAETRASQVARMVPKPEIVSPLELSTIAQAAQFREIAAMEFIIDPNKNAVEYHYARTDRPWRKAITLDVMRTWATQDRWVERREDYATQMQTRVLEKFRNEAVKRRIGQLEEVEEVRGYLLEYLKPLRSKDGKVRRYPLTQKRGRQYVEHPLAGLPMFPLELGNTASIIKRFIDLERHLMTVRGELPDREAGSVEAPAPVTALLPPGTEFTQAEVQVLARLLLRERQPDLQDQPEINIKPSDTAT